MKLFSSLDKQDRKLLAYCLLAVVVIAVIAGFFARNQNTDDNPIPSSYLTGRHGARAAFELLQSSGYPVQRWEQPLNELAQHADAQTVVILAEPFAYSNEARQAVGTILDHGGRVVATGPIAGLLLPEGQAHGSSQFESAACKLTPRGFDPLASSGEVWMVPSAGWTNTNPAHRVEYDCAGQPMVVEYAPRKGGHVVWWASSTPLENGSIARAGNFDLFLNSLGEREGHRFYWDESLHGETHSAWSYASGPAFTTLILAVLALGLLMVFSFSRRSGPVRDLPQPPRATPIEFIDALGSLYSKAGAAPTAVAIAYDRFRRRMGDHCGQNGLRWSAAETALVLRRRFPQASPELEADLEACAEAVQEDRLPPKKALALVQRLDRHTALLEAALRVNQSAVPQTKRKS